MDKNSYINSIFHHAKQTIKIVLKNRLLSHIQIYLKHFGYRNRLRRNKNIRLGHPETEAINAFISALEDGDTVWDIGAMRGSYTQYICAAVQPEAIHAFEPNPLHFENCKQTVSFLPGKFTKKAHQVALSDEPGSFYFATEMPADANTSAGAIVNESELNRFDPENIVKVPVKTGDQVIQNGGSAPPTALKIDVEGAEMNVLNGLSRTFSAGDIRTILCEVHLPTEGPSQSIEDFGYSRTDLHDFFEKRGYTVRKVNQRDRDYHILAVRN